MGVGAAALPGKHADSATCCHRNAFLHPNARDKHERNKHGAAAVQPILQRDQEVGALRECSEKRARADAQVLQGVADGPHEHCTKNVLTTLGARRCRQQFGVGWARKSKRKGGGFSQEQHRVINLLFAIQPPITADKAKDLFKDYIRDPADQLTETQLSTAFSKLAAARKERSRAETRVAAAAAQQQAQANVVPNVVHGAVHGAVQGVGQAAGQGAAAAAAAPVPAAAAVGGAPVAGAAVAPKRKRTEAVAPRPGMDTLEAAPAKDSRQKNTWYKHNGTVRRWVGKSGWERKSRTAPNTIGATAAAAGASAGASAGGAGPGAGPGAGAVGGHARAGLEAGVEMAGQNEGD